MRKSGRRIETWLAMWLLALIALFLAIPGHAVAQESTAQESDDDLKEQVSQLVRDLESDRLEDRDSAEKKLIALSGENLASGDRLLDLLPIVNPQMPPGLQTRLVRIRRKVDQKLARSVVVGSKVTLDAKKMPLAEVLDSIEKQTGNRLIDYREEFGQESLPIEITLAVTDEPFWQAVDKLLDATGLAVYGFAEESGLALVARPSNAAPRAGKAIYAGPFRIEATRVTAQRDFRQPENEGLSVNLEVAWEPRLQPIVLSQPLVEVFATDSNSQAIPAPHPDQSFDVEVQTGSRSTDLTLPFKLPSRTVPEIALLRGTLHALVPGRVAKFEFDKFDEPKPQTQQRAGVAVTLDKTKRDGDILEVHMRVRLEEPGDSLASHRGWIFQNPAYLVNKDGERIENAGFETTLQNETEVGATYLFDVPEGEQGLKWVYETPAAIVEMPVPYEMRGIKLP